MNVIAVRSSLDVILQEVYYIKNGRSDVNETAYFYYNYIFFNTIIIIINYNIIEFGCHFAASSLN